jgi:hypothetical protein
MTPVPQARRLPPAGAAREALREKGQFWTPDWVTEAMVAYALSAGAETVFDPAVGEGAFLRAAKAVGAELRRTVSLLGTEIDPGALSNARAAGLAASDLAAVEIRDFIADPPPGPFPAIVANPPYIRHHRLSRETKARLRHIGTSVVGSPLDGRAGLHVYFLIRSLLVLAENGRLAFIMPADTCEGVFARRLWDWIARAYRLDAVITFEPHASPFPGVDTNAVIFFLCRAKPSPSFAWVRVHQAGTGDLKAWVLSGLMARPGPSLSVCPRALSEGLTTGLSRPPCGETAVGPVLADYASVVRGIATGANEFFFLTRRRASDLGIPDAYLVRAVARTRDVVGDEITCDTLSSLEAAGRPTFLLSVGGERLESLPVSLRRYLALGEARGVSRRPLVAQRRPWYRMETRRVPPFLFAYLGRRNARFIRNSAGVIPLTGFLCVYPRNNGAEFLGRLWQVLSHPTTLSNLRLVGKSYGGGAIKVEPRALERLPLPAEVVQEVGLQPLALFGT